MSVKQLVAEARTDAERALQLRPDLAAAQLALGYSDYYGRGDYPGALKAFATALARRPNDADTLAARGFVERREGRYNEAIESFQQALRQDPRNSVLAFELGATFMADSRYTDAEAWLQRALALEPDNFNARYCYSTALLFRTGDVARAMVVAHGDEPVLQLSRVALLTYQRKYPQALALLDSVPDVPDNFSVVNGSKALQRAALYQLMGEKAKARPLFEQAVADAHAQVARQQGINLGFAWQNLASAELGLGHVDQAMNAIAKVKEIVAHSPDVTYGLQFIQVNAALYAEAGRADLAVPLLGKLLATPGLGTSYAPVLLWLDPVWDPIRQDPRFQALLQQYAKYRPAAAASAPVVPTAVAPGP
jgi:tetratricopeptide (TPR) repeat protein